MTTHREPDPEGDKADEGKLKEPACPVCGGPVDLDGDCIDPLCPGGYDDEDEDDDPDFEEGLLGEDDDA